MQHGIGAPASLDMSQTTAKPCEAHSIRLHLLLEDVLGEEGAAGGADAAAGAQLPGAAGARVWPLRLHRLLPIQLQLRWTRQHAWPESSPPFRMRRPVVPSPAGPAHKELQGRMSAWSA
jgi:hypothetical protein